MGKGAFGVVYAGWQTGLSRPVAIKEFLPNQADMCYRDRDGITVTPTAGSEADFEDWLQRFVREAKVLAKFAALPGVVTAHDVFENRGTAYLVMERLDGGSLKQYLHARPEDQPVDSISAMALFESLLDTLDSLHAAEPPVFHRDITLNNVFVRQQANGRMTPILLDFGLAREGERRDREDSTVVGGTRGYAPPEQWTGKGRIGPATDFYALAAVVRALLTKEPPPSVELRIHNVDDLAMSPLRQLRPDLQPGLADLLDRCLSLRYEDRPANSAEIRRHLAGLSAGGGTCEETLQTETQVLRRGDQTPGESTQADGTESAPTQQTVRSKRSHKGLALLLALAALGMAVSLNLNEIQRVWGNRQADVESTGERSEAGNADAEAFEVEGDLPGTVVEPVSSPAQDPKAPELDQSPQPRQEMTRQKTAEPPDGQDARDASLGDVDFISIPLPGSSATAARDVRQSAPASPAADSHVAAESGNPSKTEASGIYFKSFDLRNFKIQDSTSSLNSE